MFTDNNRLSQLSWEKFNSSYSSSSSSYILSTFYPPLHYPQHIPVSPIHFPLLILLLRILVFFLDILSSHLLLMSLHAIKHQHEIANADRVFSRRSDVDSCLRLWLKTSLRSGSEKASSSSFCCFRWSFFIAFASSVGDLVNKSLENYQVYLTSNCTRELTRVSASTRQLIQCNAL